MVKPEDLITSCSPTWCPGCGNFAIWGAFKNAAVKSGWDNTNTALVAGIGCHGNITNFIKITSFEGLHGRAIPLATGIKLANNKLNVFVFTGDGDSMGEGGNHFIHGCRRNHDVTVLIHNNGVYGLTTGQTTPLSPHGFKSKSTPQGNLDWPLLPINLAIASGATFVARALATDIPKLTELITLANNHQGFSVIDILQPCITFNKEMGPKFLQENTYYLGEDYNSKDKEQAFKKSLEWGEKKIPLGILYEEDKSSYESELPQISQKTLIENSPENRDLTTLFKKFV